jgi:hypothetical protein
MTSFTSFLSIIRKDESQFEAERDIACDGEKYYF